ncbi:MAG: HDIG domain-containing protein [Gomphosphaeria aponina SAG 52.96 = DSM 107014]|uniref:HDIG domain-containing protein n=1 Tax=Gomphosphaeria aponina SAG 52.96 = DSM 107014 TaxID=1521640 RepID=A0A941GWU5_9CHRO|nr:HDIG domain-containing protein [Gomphosphaeria aponina SAG 52.96 = DSM 107014]
MKTLNTINGKIAELQQKAFCSLSQEKLSSKKRRVHKAQSPLMLTLVIATVTSVVGYRFYNQPQLAVNTVSPVRVEAPRDGSFKDVATTEELQKTTRNASIPVLKVDSDITGEIRQKLAKHLNEIEELRKIAGSLPFVDEKILSLPSQKHLRAAQEWEWQKIQEVVYRDLKVKSNDSGLFFLEYEDRQIKAQSQQVITELKNYHGSADDTEFETLMGKIVQGRNKYALAWQQLNRERTAFLSDEEKVTLLAISDSNWETTKQSILQASERILTQGVPPGLPDNLIEQAVKIQLGATSLEGIQPLGTKLIMDVLKPNLTKDEEETKRRAERAVQEVEPVIVKIEQGEIIVDVAQEITQEQFVLLDGFGLSRRGINWGGIGLSAVVVTGGLGICFVVAMKVMRRFRCRDEILLCLLSVSAPLLALIGVPYTNLPLIGLLVSSFYGPILAVTQVVILTGLVVFTTAGAGWEFLVAGAVGGLLAAVMAGRLHSREDLAQLGGIVGLTQGGVYFIVSLILSGAAKIIWSALLPGSIIYGLSGLAWSVVALGLSPYLERFFDLLTPIRLAELSNPNRPLLKRLATEAPGTFQHTVFVATLAEAAARELHCNVELVRAGTLYHDIGKMHDPLGFIENQFAGKNKHDQINDPYKSAEIIKKHVSEGLVMARKYGLPKAICDFIPQHQGTLLISYFYFQAKNQGQEKGVSVHESDFRYDGPIPQSRETAIVMLADGCEAALRSLKDATPEIALATVKKIFQARWRDGELADSGLKYEELPIIARVFVRTWQQCNHKRIAYPQAALEPQNSQLQNRNSEIRT